MILTEANHRFVPAMVTFHAERRWADRIGPHDQLAESFAAAVLLESHQNGRAVAMLDLSRDALFILEPRTNAPASWVIITVKRYSEDTATRVQGYAGRLPTKRSRGKRKHYSREQRRRGDEVAEDV